MGDTTRWSCNPAATPPYCSPDPQGTFGSRASCEGSCNWFLCSESGTGGSGGPANKCTAIPQNDPHKLSDPNVYASQTECQLFCTSGGGGVPTNLTVIVAPTGVFAAVLAVVAAAFVGLVVGIVVLAVRDARCRKRLAACGGGGGGWAPRQK